MRSSWLVSLRQVGICTFLRHGAWHAGHLQYCLIFRLGRLVRWLGMGCVVQLFLFHLLYWQLHVFNFCNETIFFELKQHFFFKRHLVLPTIQIKLLLKLLVSLFITKSVCVQLRFFLLDSSVVNFLEISLLAQLVVGGACLLRDDPGFVEFFLQYC